MTEKPSFGMENIGIRMCRINISNALLYVVFVFDELILDELALIFKYF